MPTSSKSTKRNKLGDKENRKTDQIKGRLKKSSGRDNAERIGTQRTARQTNSGRGGGANSGGEPQKKARIRGRRSRSGSESNASK